MWWSGADPRSGRAFPISRRCALILHRASQVRLGDVATVRIAPDPVAIDHNSVSRSLDVTAVVNGRSAADVAQEVTSRLRGISFPYEYHAEVLGDAARQQANQVRVAAIAAVVVLLSFLILQAATGSWGLAAVLMITLPVALVGGVLVAPLVGGISSIGVLVALFAVLALAIRQALVFVRRARELGAEPGASPTESVQQAVRELAPSVIGVALVTAAIMVAPAVMGTTAGLEEFHPFAVSMLAGLVTATARLADRSARLLPGNRQPGPVERKGASGNGHSCTRI